ncbi:TolB family protein [Microbacterium paludicola]|uniref:TolB family protein n=1 Tax=Microbacterium paludicola TaxID=300019 RepID=UPI0038794EC7
MRENSECPSISPDGTRIAYKTDRGGQDWGIAVLDLATGVEHELAEARSVDDQLEWLDDDTVLYGLPRRDEAGVTDVWALDLAPRSTPTLFIPQAWSPSVVR